jgi:hypothetical protein
MNTVRIRNPVSTYQCGPLLDNLLSVIVRYPMTNIFYSSDTLNSIFSDLVTEVEFTILLAWNAAFFGSCQIGLEFL